MRRLFAMLLSCIMVVSLAGCGSTAKDTEDSIKIGLIFSLTGGTAITEESMYNSALMAIDEVNADGGINGKKLEAVVEDYATDASTAAEKIKKLILEDEVVATVGLYTSASRIAATPILEDNDGLLVYPTFYEGEKPSSNIIYTGCVPNQQGDLFIPWLVENVGKKVFLLGTDTVYAQGIHAQAKTVLAASGGEIAGEELVPSDQSDFSTILAKIADSGANVIYANLNGDSSVSFYKQYASYGLKPETTPICSFITDEAAVAALGDLAVGHYTSVNYFNSVDSEKNKKYLESYADKYGSSEGVTAVAESSYTSVKLLAEALKKCETYDTASIISAFEGLEYDAPQGKVKIDADSHHIWCKARIGRVNADGRFDIVFESEDSIEPDLSSYQ